VRWRWWGGIPAVLIAAFLVKTMSVEMLRWLVSIVVLYTALVMLRAAFIGRRTRAGGRDHSSAGG